jgi:hypothetical protein
MTDFVNSRALAYELSVTKKHNPDTKLSIELIYDVMKKLNALKYERRNERSAWRKIKGTDLSIAVPTLPALNVKGTTKVQFIFDKETRETFPAKDAKGNKHPHNLPKDENIYYITHGNLVLRKKDGNWQCLLILEKRKNTLNVDMWCKYIQQFDSQLKIDYEQVIPNADLMKILGNLSGVKWAVLKNQTVRVVEDGDGWETAINKEKENAEKKKLPPSLHTSEIKVDLSPEEGIWNHMKLIGRAVLKKDIQETSKDVKELVTRGELKFYGKLKSEKTPRLHNLFEDVTICKLEIKLTEPAREIDSEDFFSKLDTHLTQKRIDELFDS